ncbi:GNAT family N-acetyltransferase [Bombilactobacillus bombi]|uniref:GNAT family N-acetyltransferase n=1 Tax=Bombilactobacillus bombi TaxID=1303590 RepID=A0A3R6V9H6_9LACO|nr:GNAT family N-acetyltransferase [Bombilactobacillus bombi]RHW50255.1 GNAT family N-acetyltransferase [Bombilactobacillus bombi]
MKILMTNSINSSIYQNSLQIRQEVFVQEQKVPTNIEVDNYEERCTYYVGYINHTPVATARNYLTEDHGWHIQRVAVLKKYRQQGYARELLTFIENQARQQHINYLILGAQDQAQPFYLKQGFTVVGEQFVEAGIKHHNMIKQLTN